MPELGAGLYDPFEEPKKKPLVPVPALGSESPTLSTLPFVPPTGQQTLGTGPTLVTGIVPEREPMVSTPGFQMPGVAPVPATPNTSPEGMAEQYGTLPDVEELRADPYTAKYEQSAIARADELSSERFNTLRQQRANEMARQGIGPDSPFWQSEMRKIDQGQAVESSGFRRQLELDKVQQRFQRLAQARSVEATQSEMERQQLADMYSMVSGTPYQPSSALASLIATQGMQAADAGAGAASGMRGLSDLLAAYMASNRQPFNINLQNPAPTPATPPWMNQMYPGTWE